MADITVTVAAPGAKQAAGEVRDLEKASAAVARTGDKVAASSAKVAGAMKQEAQAVDRATQAARRLAKERGGPGTGVMIAQQLGRSGGYLGGAVGRVAGAFGGGAGGLGAIGAAAVAAAVALRGLTAAADRGAQAAARELDIRQKRTSAIDAAVKSADGRGVESGLSLDGAIRTIAALGRDSAGGESAQNTLRRILGSAGPGGGTEGAKAFASLVASGSGVRAAGEFRTAEGAAATGLVSITDAADIIAKNPGILAGTKTFAEGVARILSEKLDREFGAEQVRAMLDRVGDSSTVARLDTVTGAKNAVSGAEFDRFLSSPTLLEGLQESLRAVIEPQQVAIQALAKPLEEAAAQMRAASEAQRAAAAGSGAIVATLSELGRALGLGQGSYGQQARDAARDAAQAGAAP